MSGTGQIPPASDAPPAPEPAVPSPSLPLRGLPRAPSPGRVWARALVLAGVFLAVWLLDQLANLFMDYWLLESMGYEDVFWTNFWMGAGLFALALGLTTLAVAAPAFVGRLSRTAKRRSLGVGILLGTVGGVFLAGSYRTFLLFFEGRSFGEKDPEFGHDLGFYVFDVPALHTITHALEDLALIGIVASIVLASISPREDLRPAGLGRARRVLGRIATPLTLIWIGVLGAATAFDIWLQRYDLLSKDNTQAWRLEDSPMASGAEKLDVTGLFSTKNALLVETLATLALTVAVIVILATLRRAVTKPGASAWKRRTTRRALALALVPGLALTVLWQVGVSLRDDIQIQPNEPVNQYTYIQRAIDATNKAYSMDDVEVKEFVPNGREDPKPRISDLLESPTIRNAPLWPGYNASLETQIDPEYLDRILVKQGDGKIYGPTLDVYQQQQKLRPYYDFMDVDTVRYTIDGEQKLYASSARELPVLEPQPWLAWWGQRLVLFTHGSGLVMSLLSGQTPEGYPQYGSFNIPSQTEAPELAVKNPSIYYGEGAGSMAYSNVESIQEHDFPTPDGRAEVSYPDDVQSGVEMDSQLKRLVFGWKSRQFMEIVFSDLMEDETRVHYFRTPLERVEKLAPFLWHDTDPYAVTGGEEVTWMVNSLSTSSTYPYSTFGDLGDKSVSRTPTAREVRHVNYVQDTVKTTVNGYTGAVDFYKWKNEPVVDTWSDIYPDLFKEREEMPAQLVDQVQYPPQLMHIQFDDVYIYTHMKDALTYFSREDLFDDGDEVLGPMVDGLEGEPLNFSIEPYYWMAHTRGDSPMPRTNPPEQFAMSTIFTPEDTLNLRSIITAYQGGEDYGKLSMLAVPKGEFHPGPEQADAAIDQAPFISQQIGFWSRRGLEVIRGHTTPLVVGKELIYIEPLFIRSVQNPVPQLERVIVVFRGDAFMGETLEDALREAVVGRPEFPIRPGPELGGEPGFDENGDRLADPVLEGGLSETPDPPEGGGPPPGRGPGS